MRLEIISNALNYQTYNVVYVFHLKSKLLLEFEYFFVCIDGPTEELYGMFCHQYWGLKLVFGLTKFVPRYGKALS